MILRWARLCLLLSCLGCQTFAPVEADDPIPPAVQYWAEGQAALSRGCPDEAIRCYQQSLAADPSFTQNHLSLAAAYLEKGNETVACAHLGRYVATHPEHLVVRAHYAELLLHQRHVEEARAEFERFEAEAQDQGQTVTAPMIHCQSRLTKIAVAEDDEYAEHLHRGIGFYLLAREIAALPEDERELSVESLLCKAARELTLSHLERPEEARPCWYLHLVWTGLAQRQPAAAWLRQADEAAPFSRLTPAEQRGLRLACREE